ncbi:MAG: ankyrin repeat domain-containing protein [Candidatus Dependentiae bacterium]|nr:ankyrin repeat domain-containing protein [Candidatus Dependentiae bacterium]
MKKRIVMGMVCVIFCSALIRASELEVKEVEAEAVEAVLQAPPVEQAQEIPFFAPVAEVYKKRGLADSQLFNPETKSKIAEAIQENKQDNQIKKFTSSLIKNAAQQVEVEGGQEEIKEAADQGIDINTRSLLIFLDDGEIIRKDQNSFITMSACMALIQKAGPILMPGALLSHIFNINSNHSESAKKVLSAFYAMYFNASEWIIYRINDFFLLIPRKRQGLKNEPKLIALMADFNKQAAWLDAELKLKNKKDLFVNKNALQKYFSKENGKEYEYFKQRAQSRKLSQDFLAVCEQLFYQKIDPKKKPENIKQDTNWVIYLAGHGGYGKSIAGLSINGEQSDFKKLLNILDKKIQTKLFVYNSCYAAGFNASQVYGELTYIIDSGAKFQDPVGVEKAGFRPIKDIRTYQFPIVISAATDAPVFGRLLEPGKYFGGLETPVRYDKFIKETLKESINYSVALGYLFPLISRPAFLPAEIASIPQIRPTNVPAWFPVADVDKAVIRIGKVMAATRQKPLLVKQYQGLDGKKYDPKAILLAIDTVPFDIVIDSGIKEAPSFVSLMPGEVVHEIKQVTYLGENIPSQYQNNPSAIFGALEYGVPKVIRIKKVTCVRPVFESIEYQCSTVGSEVHCYACQISIDGSYTFFSAKDLEIALEIALEQNDYEKVRKIVTSNKADVFIGLIEKKKLAQLLDKAFSFPDRQIVTLLLAHHLFKEGVNIPLDSGGNTLFLNLIGSMNVDLMRLLLQNGANIYTKDVGGRTALHKAVAEEEESNIDVINLLLEYVLPEKIDVEDDHGNTSLMQAVMLEKLEKKEIIKLLLKKGANPDNKNDDNISPRETNPELIQEIEQEIAQEKEQEVGK